MRKSQMRKYKTSKKSKKSFFKNIKNTTVKAVPVVTTGLKKVGSTVLNATKKATPVVEKGLGTIYDTIASGFNLGIKGVEKGIKLIKTNKKNKTKRRKH